MSRPHLEEQALAALRAVSTYGPALENHCIRLAQFSLALANMESVEADEDLVRAACWLHDIGLCVTEPEGLNYLQRGMHHVRPFIEQWGLDDEAAKILEDVMLYSHSVSSPEGIGPVGDIVRRAVSVEHSFAKISHGLPKDVRRRIVRDHPRLDFNKVLLRFFKISLIDDGPAKTFRVFFPAGR